MSEKNLERTFSEREVILRVTTASFKLRGKKEVLLEDENRLLQNTNEKLIANYCEQATRLVKEHWKTGDNRS